jgi:hypothetical protein
MKRAIACTAAWTALTVVGCGKESAPSTTVTTQSAAAVTAAPAPSAAPLASVAAPASAAPAPSASADPVAEAKLMSKCCDQISKADTAGQLTTASAYCGDQALAIKKGKKSRADALKDVMAMLKGMKTPPLSACK